MEEPLKINEQIVEIRYKPNPKILDYRGTWAEMVSKRMLLPHWNIDTNRIDVYDDDQTVRAFVSFRNFGVVMRNNTSSDYFADQANKLTRFLFDQEAFGSKVQIERIGIRSRFAVEYIGDFKDLVNRYLERYINLSGEAKSIYEGSTIIDIGVPIIFSTQLGKINTNTGPMEEKQLREYFPDHKDIPSQAIFIDIDYWQAPAKEMEKMEVVQKVKSYSTEIWSIYNKFITLMSV